MLFIIIMYISASCFDIGKNYHGSIIKNLREITTADDCQKQCQINEQCVVWTLDPHANGCWLHSKASANRAIGDHLVSGPKWCPGMLQYI